MGAKAPIPCQNTPGISEVGSNAGASFQGSSLLGNQRGQGGQECRYRYMIFVSTEENYFAAAKRISKSIKNCEKEYTGEIVAINSEKTNIHTSSLER